MAQRDYVSRGRDPQSNKKKSKAKPAQRNSRQQPPEQSIPATVWIRVGVVLCILLAFAAWLWSIKDNAPEPDNNIEPAVQVKTDEDGLPELPEEEWEYIKSLPGYEVEVDVTEQEPSGKRYLMQCASFRTRAQAEEMKAKIAFQGFEALIRRSSGTNGDWFRVILGPFDSKRDAERTRHTLRRSNITTCKIWYWTN
jgi:cell division protein FtsN